ncbi:hypothetical protein HanRHA438_Chr01g0041191 [Helianthus annuus]|uniref:Uncharacterized protein n=1 Tax=Helianthus annuus TaxID=4232 RepID=A0A251VRU0_HELAN|nr:UPF0481 protein At3g47200 [Helianthus annuus]XP_035831526.1 UPF0481 protein At3g47200 [Helianthus annuus]KAF5823623.1 hypothetical protein HanXRQr2_Chr01g0040331 [Helianthus annuus]KAJ0628325.1 hypothetical protein HanHA89_Chr01g0035381 [Helianthus annuus]KAJ0818307.1 hypothetical protein HanLR1_Chr00c0357g0744461 [Helianthus annuus]KAJ0949672.1 hypothetical protein HanRHA438_Chr01g0041191 [Helianthus annuus]
MSEHDQIQHSIDIPDDKILDWIIGSVTDVDANDTSQPSSAAKKIPRVPSMLSEKHNYEECFAPQDVSIGPYHYEEPKLQAFEELKPVMASSLFKHRPGALISLYKKVGEEEMMKDLRSFYEQDSTTKYSDKVFIKMMLLDSCFILYFMLYVHMGGSSRAYGSLFKSFDLVLSVWGDLLLLENQIPFKLLQMMNIWNETYIFKNIQALIHNIYMLRSSDQKRTWLKSILCIRSDQQRLESELTGDNAPDHLLHLLYLTHIPKDVSMKYKNKEYNYNSNNFPTVNQLLDVGIRFKQCDPISLKHVRFSKGWFEFSAAVQLPPITLSGETKPLLLNLIAYETGSGKDECFASYVCLLRSLIGSHEDVRVLKKAGVLQHRFGTDNDVVDFFNEIAADLIPQNEAYVELKDDIQSYYEGCSNTPISDLRREYRKSPWKFISLLGALIALFLTAVQTYFAVWSRK